MVGLIFSLHMNGALSGYGKTKKAFLGQYRSSGTDQLLGWWTSIAGADIIEMEILTGAVGNLGLNTKYHASPSRPWIAYSGDVDGSGKFRFVEACYEGDTLIPYAERAPPMVPSLASKFTTFQAFARATLPQVYEKISPSAYASARNK